jgi:large subunit ribosomal protein L30
MATESKLDDKKPAEKKSGGKVKVKWVVSFISCTDDMRATIRGLGLRRMHQVVEREDTPAIRGMIHKVRHLVEIVK